MTNKLPSYLLFGIAIILLLVYESSVKSRYDVMWDMTETDYAVVHVILEDSLGRIPTHDEIIDYYAGTRGNKK